MGRLGCDLNGNMNESKFSDPMPWIGLYVAAASVACAIAMALDVIHGFRHRKFWFPSKYLSLNATSLTIIPVAIKFSVDLNTPMPSGQDQLAKLSSAALFCTVMSNSMPSIGAMENSEIFTNVVALAILVITVAVNICIQLGTGIIYVFRIEHIFLTFLLLVLLLILSSSALTMPTIKRYLEIKYKMKHERALREGCNEQECFSAFKEVVNGDSERTLFQKLKEDLMKHWVMAHTSSPQFVIGRSATCTASGAFCLLGALALMEAMLRYYLMPQSFRFCSGESDYKWSTTLVLFSQTAAVGVGTIAPAIRWFTAINFRCPTRGKIIYRKIFMVERYWIQSLLEMKDCPLSIRIPHRHSRKLAHDAKNKLLDLCLGIQMAVVLVSKLIQILSIFLISTVLLLSDCYQELKKKFVPNNSISIESGGSQTQSQGRTRQDLCPFVLHLEGENALVEVMMKCNYDATDHWIRKGKKEQPKHLKEILNMSSPAFKGVKEIDTDLVPSLDSQQPPNCWSLTVVNLTSIALALPNIHSFQAKRLIRGVQEGLVYINLVEELLDTEEDLLNLRKAANILWQGVDLYHRWLDVDLHKISIHVESTKEVLERVSNAAKKKFEEIKRTHLNQCLNKRPTYWPIKLLAANSMYRISKTVLLNHKSSDDMIAERLFEDLSVTVSDIIGACLTNLPRIVSLKCLRSTIEVREVNVRHAAFLLGQTEDILKLLQHRAPVNLDPDQMASIDKWRSSNKRMNPSSTAPCSPERKDSSISSDFYLTIDS